MGGDQTVLFILKKKKLKWEYFEGERPLGKFCNKATTPQRFPNNDFKLVP